MIIAFILAIIYAMVGVIRPGVNIIIKSQRISRSAPTDTGTFFVVGTSDSGPTQPILVNSLAEFVQWFGNRQSYSSLYDALDLYYSEGGRRAYISRVVGPAAATATKNLLDVGAAVSLIVTAIGPGTYIQNYKIGVVAGTGAGTFQIQITDLTNNVLEQSSDLLTQADAVNWGKNSQYVRVALGASANVPVVVAPAAFTGGTDDRVNIVDANWATALALFTRDLGPGQIAAPGSTTDVRHVQLLQHGVDNTRVALLDAVDSPTVSNLTTAAANARANGRWGALFTPWVVLPGVVPLTSRTVPPSGLIAGLIATNDVQASVGTPSAGQNGASSAVVGLSQVPFTDPNRQTLNGAGVNVIIPKYGAFRNYGWRSLADPNGDPWWTNLSHARIAMFISAKGGEILEGHMFDEIDGQGRLFKRVEGQLTAMLNQMYQSGDLYGLTPTDAFAVVCDASNNTPTTILNKELHASIAFRASEFAEMIQLDLVKVPVNSTVA